MLAKSRTGAQRILIRNALGKRRLSVAVAHRLNTYPDFSLEQRFSGLVAGVDEAGCGPWAGPVVASAVIFLPECEFAQREFDWGEINDSKKLSRRQRETVFAKLMNTPSVLIGVGQASVAEIDVINIGRAGRLAMQRALASMPVQPSCAIVDGIRKPDLECQVHMVIRGEQHSLSIAAASIVAKVTRDTMMQQLDAEFPVYGWRRNAGYGTAQHREALKQHGVTIHHRRSFAPIARLLTPLGP